MGWPRMIARFAGMGAIWVGMGLAGTGCATGILQRGHHAAPIVEAAGPGTVFATIDEAAVDGLAYSYRRAKQLDGGQSALGGTVFKVAEGYSYETSQPARRLDGSIEIACGSCCSCATSRISRHTPKAR